MPLLRIIPETTNVDFVKWRWLAFSIDGLLLIVLSVVSIFTQELQFWLGFHRRRADGSALGPNHINTAQFALPKSARCISAQPRSSAPSAAAAAIIRWAVAP